MNRRNFLQFVLGAAAQFDRSHELDRLIRRCHWIGIIGSSIGGLLLIADLGRPEEISKVFVGFQKYLYQPVA